MIGALSTAITGLQGALARADKAAQNIVSPETSSGGSLPRDIVDLKIAETEFKANAAVIRTAEEMSDTLLKSFDTKV